MSLALPAPIRRGLSRLFRRSYEGAGGGRRWRDAPAAFPNNANALTGQHALRARARHACANNAHAARGRHALVAAMIGTGIKPQCRIDDAATREAFNLGWEHWTDDADADGLGDAYAVMSSMAGAMITDGEAVALMETDADTGALRLRQIASEQLDASKTLDLGNGARIVSGVEFDATGRRVAYWLLPDGPDLPFATALQSVRVDGADVIHMFERQFAGQVRGVSWFAPVLLRMGELDKALDAQLMRQQVAAMLCGFIIEPDGGVAPIDATERDGQLEGGMEPGTLRILRGGQDYRQSDPARIGSEVIDYLNIEMHAIAAGLGVPHESMTGDYSQTNYSSARASLIDFRRRIEAVQNHVIVYQLCRPVWRRWATLEILSGRLDAPGFETDPAPYLTPKWITPGWQWVDPAKEIAAQRDAVEAGFMSRREVVAGRGWDIEQLDAERAADAARNGAPQDTAA